MIYASATHTGGIRQLNEDSFYVKGEEDVRAFALVADGMGGHNAGEVASAMAVEVIARIFRSDTKKPVIKLVREAINEANLQVFERASREDDFTGMGTTLTLAIADESDVCIANVGDSRAYYYETKKKKLTQVTRDHSLAEELVAAGRLRKEDIENYPYRNVITRAVGTSVQVEPDIFMQPWQRDDVILLCSDGLTIHLSDNDIKSILKKQGELQVLCDELVQLALERGGSDNVTVALIRNTGSKSK